MILMADAISYFILQIFAPDPAHTSVVSSATETWTVQTIEDPERSVRKSRFNFRQDSFALSDEVLLVILPSTHEQDDTVIGDESERGEESAELVVDGRLFLTGRLRLTRERRYQ